MHFEGMSMDIIAQIDMFSEERLQGALFEALWIAICARWPETWLCVMKICISFDDPKLYGYVSLPPKALARGRSEGSLLLTFGLCEAMTSERFIQEVLVSLGRITVHVLISLPEEIDRELFGFYKWLGIKRERKYTHEKDDGCFGDFYAYAWS